MGGADLKVQCSGCGSSLSYSASDKALKCQYCGALTTIEKQETEGDAPSGPGLITPLSVELTDMTDAVYEHLASGALTPDHLLEHANFNKRERFYVPVFIYNGTFEAHWTASFGYDHTEHYTVYVNRTENGHTRKVPETRTKTVTDWRPVSGSDSGKFLVVGYAGSRLSAESLNVLPLVESLERTDFQEYDPRFTTDISIEELNKSEDDIWRSRGMPQVNSVIDRSVQSHAQGDHQRDWHWTADISKRGTNALMPICFMTYEFEGKEYKVWMSGSNARHLVADALPVDQKRRRSISFGFIPVCLAIASGAFSIFSLDVPWYYGVGSAAVALGYAQIRKHSIISYSVAIRKALLARQKAAGAKSGPSPQAAGVAAPNQSPFANPSLDKLILPIAAIAAVVVPLIPALLNQPGLNHSAPRAAQSASASYPTPAPQPVQRAQPQPLPASAPTPPPATATQPRVEETTTAAAPAPASAAQNKIPDALVALLRASYQGDWAAVDQQVSELKENASPAPVGDRQTARTADVEGIAALKRNDLQAASDAFQRGLAADPSDVEIKNNLAYADLRSTQLPQALTLLNEVLLQAPDRVSGWSNLSEVLSGDAAASTAAMKLAVHFNPNRARITTVLGQQAQSNPNPQYRANLQAVLAQIDSIPTIGGDTPTVRTAALTPASAPTDAGQPGLGDAVRQMLSDGRTCFEQKEFTCSITNARNVLRLQPNNPAALELQSRAQQAQATALRGIKIE